MNIWLHRYSLLVVFLTLLLIAAGGLVTSNEAGLAVPDWPLSYGQMFPPMVGNIFWEHGHRMIAGTVGILSLILTILIQIKEKRAWLKKLAWITFMAVVAQALLGGLTVIYMLPAPVSISHACLAQIFLCLNISIAYFLWQPQEGSKVVCSESFENMYKLRRLLILTTSFIFIQLILGATVRHTGMATVFHIIMAFIVLIHILLSVLKIASLNVKDKLVTRTSSILGGLIFVQLVLGFGAFIYTQMLERSYEPSNGEVLFTASHQTLGALILGITVFLVLRVNTFTKMTKSQ